MRIFKNERSRLAFRFGRASGLRSTNDVVEQLQDQLAAERQQHAFNMAELERQLAVLSRELAEARLELAQRNLLDTFASAPSPSSVMH